MACVALGVLSSVPGPADAGVCHISATQIDFGRFDPLVRGRSQSVGYLTYNCTLTVINVRIRLSAGQSQNGSQRVVGVVGDGRSIPYSLALDPSQTQIWGDGFGATSLYMASGAPAHTDIRVPIYAVLLNMTVPRVGLYTDTITAQLSWE